MLEALVGAAAGSLVAAVGLIVDRGRHRSAKLKEEAQTAMGIQRDIGHLKRDLMSLSEAIKLMHDDLEETKTYIRRIAAKAYPEILEDFL